MKTAKVRTNRRCCDHHRASLLMRAEDSTTLRTLHRQLGPASKTKVVVVILSGGPVDSSQPAEVMGSGMVGAVVAAWQPGEEGTAKRPVLRIEVRPKA